MQRYLPLALSALAVLSILGCVLFFGHRALYPAALGAVATTVLITLILNRK
jgi:hypothetical protein